MVACVAFRTSKFVKAFTIDPVTFVVGNVCEIPMPPEGVGNPDYHSIFRGFETWLTKHADGTNLYYDGPKFAGDAGSINFPGMSGLYKPKKDTIFFIQMLLRHKQHNGLSLHLRDTETEAARTAVKKGKPLLECLLVKDDTEIVRLSFAIMRDHFQATNNTKKPPTYNQALTQLEEITLWKSIKDFIETMLPASQRKVLSLNTLRKACLNWGKTSGPYFDIKELLKGSEPGLYNIYESIYQRTA